MTKGFFSKDFWNKRRKIIAGVLAGVSIAAVAIAVPVALTSKSGATSSSAAVQPPEVRDVQDEQKNEKYAKTVVYGTPIEQALGEPVVLEGYGPGVLDLTKTTYTPTTDVDAEGIVAVYVYTPLAGGNKKELIVGVLISKAPVENYDFTVEQVQPLLASLTAFPVYDFSGVNLPAGRVVTNKVAKYSITDFGSPLASIGDLNVLPAKTKVSAKYVVGVDKNHEGQPGSLTVKYEVTRTAITGAKDVYRAVLLSKKGETPAPTMFADPLEGYLLQSSGYFKYETASPTGAAIEPTAISTLAGGTKFAKVDTYRLKAGQDGISTYSITQPYVVVEELNQFVNPGMFFNIYYGSSISLDSPSQQTGYGEWSAPVFKLLTFPDSSKNNHDSAYDNVSDPLTIDQVSRVPANSSFSVTYNATKTGATETITYSLVFNVRPVLLSLPDVLQAPVIEQPFGSPLTVNITAKPDAAFGTNASFDASYLSYVIGKQTDGEAGIYVNGYVIPALPEAATVPVGSVIFVQANAKPSTENVAMGSSQRLVIAYKVIAPVQAIQMKERKLVYESAVSELSKVLPTAITGYKAPVLDATRTTYQAGLVIGQKSTAVYRYDNNDATKAATYAAFEVGVTAAAIDDYAVASVELQIETHKGFPVLNVLDLNLPNGRTLKEPTPMYYDGKVDLEALGKGESIGETTKKTKLLEYGSGEYVSAVYPVHFDELRYTGNDSSFVAYYKVEPPIPVEIQYYPVVKLPVVGEAVSWRTPSPPDLGEDWNFHSAYYKILDYIKAGTEPGYTVLPSYLSNAQLTQAINEYDWRENDSNPLEVVLVFSNFKNEFLWVITPYASPYLASGSYYNISNSAKAQLYYSTRIKDKTGKFISRHLEALAPTKSNLVEGEFDPSSSEFTSAADFALKAPAGTKISLMYYWPFNDNIAGFFAAVSPRLIYGKQINGGEIQIKKGIVPIIRDYEVSDLPPFGQKNNDEPNKNRPAYSNPVFSIKKRAAANSGKYVEGRTLQDSGEIAKLPAGTVFTITRSASEINDNYLAVSKQYYVNSVTVVSADRT